MRDKLEKTFSNKNLKRSFKSKSFLYYFIVSHSSFLRGKHLLVHSVIVIVRFLHRKAQSSKVYSILVSNENQNGRLVWGFFICNV